MPRAQRGRVGARARWGPARILRLDELDAGTRGIVEAILRARSNAAEAAKPSDGTK
jgi:hypothetical protein